MFENKWTEKECLYNYIQTNKQTTKYDRSLDVFACAKSTGRLNDYIFFYIPVYFPDIPNDIKILMKE